MSYSTRKAGARNEAIKWYQQNRGGGGMFREVSVQKASVFNVIQICTSIFLGFFLIRRGSSHVPHKRNQNGKMLAPNVMARFIVSLLASPNQRLWSLCMRSIYSTPSTDRYKTHYTNLVLLIRNHNKIISKHFFVIHISLSFSDSNITISTIETETLAYLLHEELSLAHDVTLKDTVQTQCFSEFNILNL